MNYYLFLKLLSVSPPPHHHHQAKSSGKFSSEELSSLQREFQHHKDKIHEYNILMDTVSRTEGERRVVAQGQVFVRLSSSPLSASTANPSRLTQVFTLFFTAT